MEIKISDLIKLLKRKLWLLALVVFVCGGFALLISKFFVTPRYETKTTVLVQPRNQSDSQANFILYGVKMSTHWVSTEDFLLQVVTRIEENGKIERTYSTKKIRSAIKTSTNEYEFTVTVNTVSPGDSYEITKAIETLIAENRLLPSNSNYNLVISQPVEADSASVSPNLALNTVLGVFIGVVLGALLILLLDRVDKTVKGEEDIAEKFEVPVLGVIYEHRDNIREALHGKK